METVGVKVLKNRLSHYLRKVSHGEVITVTNQDKVIAEIKLPPKVPGSPEARLMDYLRKQKYREIPAQTIRKKTTIMEDLEEIRKSHNRTKSSSLKSYDKAREDRF